MSKKNKVFTVIGILTAVLIAAKAYLILSGEFWYISAWAENVLIHIGVAILVGGGIEYLAGKFKNSSIPFVELGSILIGICSYYVQVGWLYLVYLPKIKETELEAFIDSIKTSEIPWLFMLVTVATFLLAYCVLRKSPRIINPDVTEDVTMRQDIEPEEVEFKECSFDSNFAKNLMRLRKYEYGDFDDDLSVFSVETVLSEIEKDEAKLFTVSYEDKIVGYYIVKEEDDNEYKFLEIFGSPNIDYSYQVLNVSLKKHLYSLKGASIKFSNIGVLPTAIGAVIEIIVKDYTNSTYELIGTSEESSKIKYDIHFRT